MQPSFDDLWEQFLEGDLNDSGFATLQEMLATNPDLLRHATDRYEEHRLIGHVLQPFDSERFTSEAIERIRQDNQSFVGDVMTQLRPTEKQPLASRERTWPWQIGRYAAVIAATLLVSFLYQSRAKAPRQTGMVEPRVLKPVRYQSVEYVATIVRCENCRWGSTKLAAGTRLIPGDLELESGDAMIQFDGGALTLLSGPTELRLDSAACAHLALGNIIVRASEEASGFVLRTPATDIVDLGSEFVVSVEPSGTTEVHVTEGEIEWHQADRELHETAMLSQGNAIRFDADHPYQPQAISITQRRLSNSMPMHPVSTTPGRLIAYEGFEYPFKTLPTHRQLASGGHGWNNPWFCGYVKSTLDLFFAPNQSLHKRSLQHSTGGALRLPVEDVDSWDRQATKRELAEPIYLDQDGVVYFSFLLQRDSESLAADRGSFHWIMCKPRDLQSRLGVGMLSDGRPIIYGPSGNQAGTIPLQNDSTYLFVGKLVHGTHRPEQLFLKVYSANEDFESTEPFKWTIAGRASRLDQPLSQVHLYNSPGRGYMVDEIRIGSTWSAVTPSEFVVNPSEALTQ